MRILVTGGAGFIGSHLCERLVEEGNEVLCLDNFFTGRRVNILQLLDNPRFELIRHDVTEPILLEVDQIYNLACPASPVHYQYNPVKTVKTNVMGAINMLGLAKRVHARILQASTSEVYGDPLVHPQTEGYWGNVNPIGLRSCYDEGKRIAETLMTDYHRQNNVDIRIARIFNTYGPRQSARAVIPTIITQALNGSEIRLGNLEPTRDLNFVADTVEGFIKAAETPKAIGETINLGSGREISIRDLAALILKLMNRDIPIALEGARVRPENSEVDRLCADSRKGQSILGWTPKYSLEDGLAATVEWIRENSERYRTGYVV